VSKDGLAGGVVIVGVIELALAVLVDVLEGVESFNCPPPEPTGPDGIKEFI
jgi:hypothetical protein